MSIQSNPSTNYTQYLADPATKQVFLAGCRAMADIIGSSSSDDVAFLLNNRRESHLISLLLQQQSWNADIARRDAANIIQHSKLDKATSRAMVLGFAVNDNGFATDQSGYIVEDGEFNLIAGHAREPWPFYLARNKQTGTDLTREEYDRLTPEQQEHYELRRYLDLFDEQGILLQRVVEDDAAYMDALVYWSIENDPAIFRYLSECGAGHGELPRGRLYDYRETVITAAKKLGVITPMLASQIEAGYVNSIGQFYLAQLQSLKVALTPNCLFKMTAYELATLKLILTTNADEMAYSITNNDIMYYRNVNGEGMPGAIDVDEHGHWTIVRADDPRCELYAQKNYICEILIPRVNDVIVQAFTNASDETMADVKPAELNELLSLIETIAPGFFEDDGAEEGDDPSAYADCPEAASDTEQ